MTEQEQIHDNVVRLLGTGERHNIDLALQILSSDVLEVDEQIKDAVYFATAPIVTGLKADFLAHIGFLHKAIHGIYNTPDTPIDWILKEHILFGLQVKLVNQLPILEYNLFGKHTWIVDFCEKSKESKFPISEYC